MAIRIKKELEKRLEPILAEKGFVYDSSMTGPGNPVWVYVRGGPFPSPDREEIWVTRSSFGPFISVDLRSTPKQAFKDLGYLAGEKQQKWWPIATKEQVNEALSQIIEWLDKYAWKWFEEES